MTGWPLRRRMVLLMVAVVAAELVVSVAGLMLVVFGGLYADVDDRLRDAQRAAAASRWTEQPAQPPVLSDVAVLAVAVPGVGDRVLQRQNRGGPGVPAASQVAPATGAGGPVTAAGSTTWRLLARPQAGGGWLVTAQPVDRLLRLHAGLVRMWVAVTLGTLLATALLTSALVRYGLRPLTRLAVAAGRIEAGDRPGRLPVTTADEVGRLATALNRMLDRLQRSFQQRQAADERLRRFVDDAGHELRTPVTAIRGWADLYDRGGVPAEAVPTAMRRISDEARRIGALVEDLLLLASLDGAAGTAAQVTGTRRRLDLAEVVRDAVLDAQVIAPDRPVRCLLPQPGTAMVIGDPMALHQVVANLLANVRAHTPPGTAATVELATVVDAGTAQVLLRVTDEGPGIPADVLNRIFDRFFRADPGRPHRDGGGAGLGLSIVAAIAAAHGGSAHARSVGAGLAVTMLLPATTPEDIRANEQPHPDRGRFSADRASEAPGADPPPEP